MGSSKDTSVRTLESGDIFFLYRPRVERDEVRGIKDIQRFYVALKPEGRKHYRLMVLGRKRLPDLPGHERIWGYVDRVSDDPKHITEELRAQRYKTKTRGERTVPAARPAGEGRYVITRIDGQMHLVYALELPNEPAEVQRDLNVAPEASFALSVKNPEVDQRTTSGLPAEDKPRYPREKQETFRGRRFQQEDPSLFDYEGTEFVLVGARRNPEQAYGLRLEPEEEDLRTADIVKHLKTTQSRHPVQPLISGEWR